MKKRILAITLSLIQLCLLIFAAPVTVVAEPASFSVGADNSLLMPTYAPAVTNSYTDSPQWLSTAIINEIRLDTATEEGTLTAAIRLLDYYEQLGINCLWVTPVNETPIDNGYTNNGLHTIDLELTEAETYEEGWQNFGKFVEAAHSRNIRILLDVIIWGVHYDAPMKTDPAYSGVVSNVENSWGGWSYNYASNAYINYYTDTMLNIIETTNIDGLRVDLAPSISGCSSLLGGIRKKAFEKGHPIVIMAEGQANDRTGGTGSKVYDLEQVGVIDYVNKYHWSDDYLNSLPESQRNDNWLITVHNPPNWWLSGASGSDIVTTTKNGKYYAASSRYQNWGLSGTNQYYTYTVSSHDYPSGEGDNVLAYGYSAIFAPVIPVWMAGDEAGSIFGLGTGNSLYFNAMVNTDLPAASGQAEFYKKIKKYIEIRRTYSDIFSFFPSNHRNTNICAVNVSGISTYQAYARYANGKAVIIVPNGTENDADITVTIPVSAAGIDSGYTVTDLLSNKSLNASKDKFTVSVAAGDMAVILVDDGTATTGSETTVAANKAARVALRNSAVGAVEALIKAISPVTVNSATAIERAEKAYNALSDSEKLKVKGYYDLLKAREQYNAVIANGNDSKYAGILKDGDMYPNSSTYIKWGWSNTMDELGETGDGGYNFNYNYTADGAGNKSGWNKEYRFEIMRPVSLNGATAQFTVNPEGSYYEKIFFLKISPKHMDMTENGNIGIKFDMAGGQVFFRVNNTACDHSSMVGYNASYPDRIFKALGNTVALSFNYADDGGLIININGTDFKISADDFNKAYGVKSAEQVLFYVSPCDSSYPDVTIDYLNTGTKKVTKSCDEYKIKIADMLPAFEGGYASWVNYINRSDSSAGLKIEYLNVLNTDFRLWTKNAYNLDGLHLKLTYNGNEYNDRMFMLSFTNSSNNTDKGLHIKIDSMGQQMYVGLENKGWINTTGLPTTMGGYPDRVFDPAFNRDTIELLITKQKDGGFIINVNGYKFPVTKDQIKSIPSLTDTKCVYVGISSIGSSPDLTVNYLHSGEDLCYSCEKGDVNCDHFINILDFIKLKKNISDGIDIYSADLDGDGIGDSEDLAIIRKMLLGVKI